MRRAIQEQRALAEVAVYEQKLRSHRSPHGAMATLGFAGLGGAYGALIGPVGIAAGVIAGAFIGAAIGIALADERATHAQRDHELDDLIGVTSGSLGHPLTKKPAVIGAFSAASMGSAGLGAEESPPDAGPMPRGDA